MAKATQSDRRICKALTKARNLSASKYDFWKALEHVKAHDNLTEKEYKTVRNILING